VAQKWQLEPLALIALTILTTALNKRSSDIKKEAEVRISYLIFYPDQTISTRFLEVETNDYEMVIGTDLMAKLDAIIQVRDQNVSKRANCMPKSAK
jgi:hypothetical protein